MDSNFNNILFINNSDIAGGAALGTYRLHEELIRRGFGSKVLVGFSKSNDRDVSVLPKTHRLVGPLAARAGSLLSIQYLQNLDALHIPKRPEFRDADIVNLHCTHNRQFNPFVLPRLTHLKPTIWKLSDMWPFTGHCAYSFDCERWKSGCGNCPYLRTYPGLKHDTTRTQWKIKQWIYHRSVVDLIVPSIWMGDLVKQSMMSRFAVHHIPNGIDTTTFYPINKRSCRAALGLPQDKSIVLIGSQSTQIDRKGGDLIVRIINGLSEACREEIAILTFGQAKPRFCEAIGISVYGMGYIESEAIKASIYSAADLMLFTTRADNSPLTILESLACGTPCLSFDVGGVKELICSEENGYVVPAFDVEQLTAQLERLLSDPAERDELGFKARKRILKNHKIEQQADRYLEVYAEAQAKHNRNKKLHNESL
jgi:glycosyltransferase involved in cell wall biosynthesis